HSVVFHPTKPGVIFATITELGARSGIWFSEDGGQHWIQLTNGLSDPENLSRTSLAVSPSNPDIIYAFAGSALSARSDLLQGVYGSEDVGRTWREISGKPQSKHEELSRYFADEDQIYYGNTI